MTYLFNNFFSILLLYLRLFCLFHPVVLAITFKNFNFIQKYSIQAKGILYKADPDPDPPKKRAPDF